MKTLCDYFSGKKGFVIDRRAPAVGVHHPYAVTIEVVPSFQDAFAQLQSVNVFPCAIIREDGHVFIMSAGGSALIWVCGEPNEKQLEATEKVYRTLRSMGAVFGFSQIDGFPND